MDVSSATLAFTYTLPPFMARIGTPTRWLSIMPVALGYAALHPSYGSGNVGWVELGVTHHISKKKDHLEHKFELSLFFKVLYFLFLRGQRLLPFPGKARHLGRYIPYTIYKEDLLRGQGSPLPPQLIGQALLPIGQLVS